MRTTVTINIDVINKLKRSKEVYNYSTMQDLLSAMNNFFIENGLRPDEKVNYHLTSSIQEIKADFKNRDESLRKWIGRISHVDLSSIQSDLTIIKEYLAFKTAENVKESVKENVAEFVQKEIEQPKITAPNLALERQIEQEKLKDERHENAIKTKNERLVNYHNSLIKIMEKPIFPQGKDKVFFEITKEFYDKLRKEYL